MKVLFLVKYSSYLSSKEIYSFVKNIVEESGNEFVSNIKYAPSAAKNPEDYVLHTDKLRKSADIIIADINEESSGIGHDIEWSIQNRKPTLIFFDQKNKNQVSIVLSRKRDKLLTTLQYSDKEELKAGLEEFIEGAKQKLDTKFILIISPEIDRYLEWAADFKRMHKAQIVRNSVEKEMENDKDYKKHQEEQTK